MAGAESSFAEVSARLAQSQALLNAWTRDGASPSPAPAWRGGGGALATPPPRGAPSHEAHASSLLALASPPPAPPPAQPLQPLPPPSASADLIAAALIGEDPCGPSEAAFAAVLPLFGQGRASEAPAAFQHACLTAAAAYRQAASGALPRGGVAAALQAEAEGLEAEARSWSLLDHLLGAAALREARAAAADEASRAALPLRGALSQRLRCAARAGDPGSPASRARLAAVVAWLEAGAAAALGAGEALQDRFGPSDGAWGATRREAASNPSQSAPLATASPLLVRELDMDAVSRTGLALHPASAEEEARLQAALFSLLKAGRLGAAQALAQAAGQPWRAASFGTGAGFGFAPVGAAAQAAAAEEGLDAAAAALTETATQRDARRDALAAELAGSGGPAARALWKWTCAAAAAAAAAAQHAGAAAPLEAACYGVLAGDLRRILPACAPAGSEAALWARCRCLLDARADAALRAEASGGEERLIEGEALCAAAPATPRADGGGALLAPEPPRWPTAAALAALPPSLAAAFEDSALAGDSAAARHRGMQAQLALCRWQPLAAAAFSAAAAADLASSRGAAALRFGAHLLLALRHLAPAAAGFGPGGGQAYEADKMLREYSALVAAHGRLSLVPAYAAHILRPELRLPTMLQLWTLLACGVRGDASPDAEGGCEPAPLRRRCYEEAAEALGVDGAGGVRVLAGRCVAASRDVFGPLFAHAAAPPDEEGALPPMRAPAAAAAAASFAPRLRMLDWAGFGGADTAEEAAAGAALLAADIGLALAAEAEAEAEGGDANAAAVLECARSLLFDTLPQPLREAAEAGQLGPEGAILTAWAGFFGAEEGWQRWVGYADARCDAEAAGRAPSAEEEDAESRAAAQAIEGALAMALNPAWNVEEGAEAGGAHITILFSLPHASSAGRLLRSSLVLSAPPAALAMCSVCLRPLLGEEEEEEAESAVVAAALDIASPSASAAVAVALAALRGRAGPGAADAPRPRVSLVAASPPAAAAALSRAVALPHLIMRCASVEAAAEGRVTRAVEAVAGAEARLATLMSTTQLKKLLFLARGCQINALDGGEADGLDG